MVVRDHYQRMGLFNRGNLVYEFLSNPVCSLITQCQKPGASLNATDLHQKDVLHAKLKQPATVLGPRLLKP